jgi:hypothetical protein
MRLLVIGMPLPNQKIDNYSFFSAPSFFDYDAVLIDPAAIVQAVNDVLNGGAAHATAADEPIVNAPSNGLQVGLADLLKRRRDETERLLERGGTVALFARPSQPFRFIAGMPAVDQYFWLPAPAGMAYAEPYLIPAFGTEVVPTDTSNPLTPFITAFDRWFHYRAYFAENVPSFSGVANVFARSVGGAAVGVRFQFGRGHVYFLPAMFSTPEGDPRFNLASTLLNCLTQSVHAAPSEEPPEWVADVRLPGIETLEAAADEAANELQEANERYQEAQTKLDQVARFRRLLWQEGLYGLESVVRDALQTLGFTVNIDVDQPGVIRADGRVAFLEVEGSEDTVVEWPYFRLQKRLERDLMDTKEPKKGLIVVNGHRLRPPDEREAQYTDALRIACENYRYALLTADHLLDLVREAETRADAESQRRLRDLIFEMVGDNLPPGFPNRVVAVEPPVDGSAEAPEVADPSPS